MQASNGAFGAELLNKNAGAVRKILREASKTGQGCKSKTTPVAIVADASLSMSSLDRSTSCTKPCQLVAEIGMDRNHPSRFAPLVSTYGVLISFFRTQVEISNQTNLPTGTRGWANDFAQSN